MQDVRAGQDALIDLFSRMEFFFVRMEKYIHVRPSAAMTDVIVKIMVEVITILGIVMKEVGEGRTSMSFLVDFYFCKNRRQPRAIPEEISWKERYRKCASAPGKIDAGRGSHGSNGSPDNLSPHR